jgi:hypothetical protein
MKRLCSGFTSVCTIGDKKGKSLEETIFFVSGLRLLSLIKKDQVLARI